jgi:elongation factor G
VQTEKVWQYAAEQGLPRLAVVNKMDRENASFEQVLDEMRASFGPRVFPIQLPIGQESAFAGIVDLVSMKAYVPKGNDCIEQPIPAEMEETAALAREELIEAVAEADDDVLTKYLDGAALSEEEIIRCLLQGIKSATVFPVFCASAVKNIGMRRLLDAIVDYLPAPTERPVTVLDKKTEEAGVLPVDDKLAALVFKTTTDPFVGRLNFFRVFSGTMKPDTMLFNVNKGKQERVGNIFTLRGKQQLPLTEIAAGDIGVVAKLQETGTGDTVAEKELPYLFAPIEFPKPMYSMCIEAKSKNDEDKIGQALAKLMDEDHTFRLDKNTETKEKIASGVGDLHLEIILEKLKRKFGVEALLKTPTVAFRETIRGKAKVEGKHKKQTGGHGQFGHVWIEMEPLAPGGGFEFVDAIFGGAVPRQYIPAVEKGMHESMTHGVLAGYPVVDVKITLVDGSYHPVDSSEMAFKVASNQAFKKAMLQAKPVLLEPLYNVEVTVPENSMGDVIGDFNGKRGRILGMEPVGGGLGVVKAQVPYAELLRYAIDLRSLTQGRGAFDMSFAHYDEMPQRMAEEIIAKAHVNKVEE